MIIVITEALRMILHIFSQIGFNANDRINSSRFASLIELDRTIHSSMIGNSQMLHP